MTTTNRIRFIRLPDLLAKVGLSRTQIYKLMREGRFPQRIRLSARSVAWLEEQVEEWMLQRVGT